MTAFAREDLYLLWDSQYQGKSRLILLASPHQKEAVTFMSTFCSANQGEREALSPGKLYSYYINCIPALVLFCVSSFPLPPRLLQLRYTGQTAAWSSNPWSSVVRTKPLFILRATFHTQGSALPHDKSSLCCPIVCGGMGHLCPRQSSASRKACRDIPAQCKLEQPRGCSKVPIEESMEAHVESY